MDSQDEINELFLVEIKKFRLEKIALEIKVRNLDNLVCRLMFAVLAIAFGFLWIGVFK